MTPGQQTESSRIPGEPEHTVTVDMAQALAPFRRQALRPSLRAYLLNRIAVSVTSRSDLQKRICSMKIS